MKKNFCSNCGNKLEDGQLFCPKCGNSVEGVSNSDSKGEKKPSIILDICRYTVGGFFLLGAFFNRSIYGTILCILISLSFFPFVYRNFLSKIISSRKSLKVLSVVLPIILLVVGPTILGVISENSYEPIKNEDIPSYKESCDKSVDYKDVSRYPDKYKGKKIYFLGKIVQVVSKSETKSVFRVGVSCEKYSYSSGYSCPDIIYVIYFGSNSFIEEDIVEMWGELDGNKTYTSALNVSITIPAYKTQIMEVVND